MTMNLQQQKQKIENRTDTINEEGQPKYQNHGSMMDVLTSKSLQNLQNYISVNFLATEIID